MSQSGNIKAAIKAVLDALVATNVLKEVQEDDYVTPLLDRPVTAYPVAFLTGMSVEAAEYETNRENIRTYAYDIWILQQSENIASPTDIEDLMEAVMNAFDNAPTLSGSANGAMLATTSKPGFMTDGTKSFVAFSIQVKAKTLITLNF